MLKTLVSACVFAALVLASAPAHAQTTDDRTVFTFSQPVTLPGVTLPAGNYLFRSPDSTSGRRVVQVLSGDGRQSYAMFVSIPAQRFTASEQPEIRFMETAEGNPRRSRRGGIRAKPLATSSFIRKSRPCGWREHRPLPC
jgi:hypothetical protein